MKAYAKRKSCPIHREQRRQWAIARRRSQGIPTKEQWLKQVTKSEEYHRAHKQELKQLAKRRKRALISVYRPEARGRDGRIPIYTRRVITQRRKEYIRWWKQAIQIDRTAWRIKHMARIQIMKDEAKKRREYISWWRRTMHAREIVASRTDRNVIEKLRRVVQEAIRKPNGKRLIAAIGCSASELCVHIGRQLKPGWTLDNYGKKWNIDHLTPISKFDLMNEEHRKMASHYTNLRPMAAWANRIKSDRIIRKAQQPFLPMASPILMAA